MADLQVRLLLLREPSFASSTVTLSRLLLKTTGESRTMFLSTRVTTEPEVIDAVIVSPMKDNYWGGGATSFLFCNRWVEFKTENFPSYSILIETFL